MPEGIAQVDSALLPVNVRVLGQQVLRNGRPGEMVGNASKIEPRLKSLPGGTLPDVANLNNGIFDHLQVGRMRRSSFPRVLITVPTHLCNYLKRLNL